MVRNRTDIIYVSESGMRTPDGEALISGIRCDIEDNKTD